MNRLPWTRAEIAVLSPAEKFRVAIEAIDYIADRMVCMECCGRGWVRWPDYLQDFTTHHCPRCGGAGVEL